MTSPRKPTLGFWITVALVAVLAGYPLSFGPACWWFAKSPPAPIQPGFTTIVTASLGYWPIGWVANHSPASVRGAIAWYATLFGNPLIALPTDMTGRETLLSAPGFFR